MGKTILLLALTTAISGSIIGCSSYPNNSYFPNDESNHSYDKSLHYTGETQSIIINGKLNYVLTDLAMEKHHQLRTESGQVVSIIKHKSTNALLVSAYPSFEFKLSYNFDGDLLNRKMFINKESELTIQSKRDVYAIASLLDEHVNQSLDVQIRELSGSKYF